MTNRAVKMMISDFVFVICIAALFAPEQCDTKNINGESKRRLPEFLSDLDLSSVEASDEDVEALKRVVKRLAPERNGEYQVYQGVTGQPGVDFPALTSIPATSFSCRGLKGGYYADLETNCQVFHICDNGRKISFLCPNGTIFQQSQLICDWWFKVDCSRSTELYEQSAEQLAQEEKKRNDLKKIKSEFHRPANSDESFSRSFENLDYDGRQNGRMNPYGPVPVNNSPDNTSGQRLNQLTDLRENVKHNFAQNARGSVTTEKSGKNERQRNLNYQPISRQRNQLDAQNKFNYDRSGKTINFQGSQDSQNGQNYNGNGQNNGQNLAISRNAQNNYNSPSTQNAQNSPTVSNFQYFQNNYNSQNNRNPQNQQYSQNTQYHQDSQNTANLQNSTNSQTLEQNRGDRAHRNQKFRNSNRNNLNNQPTIGQAKQVTSTYTEPTTFRTSTASPREFQQLAESAAFVSNRGNRFGKNNRNNYYYAAYSNTNNNQNDNGDGNDNKGKPEDQGSLEMTTIEPDYAKNGDSNRFNDYNNNKNNYYDYQTGTTGTAYNERTTTFAPFETTPHYSTTDRSFGQTDYYRDYADNRDHRGGRENRKYEHNNNNADNHGIWGAQNVQGNQYNAPNYSGDSQSNGNSERTSNDRQNNYNNRESTLTTETTNYSTSDEFSASTEPYYATANSEILKASANYEQSETGNKVIGRDIDRELGTVSTNTYYGTTENYWQTQTTEDFTENYITSTTSNENLNERSTKTENSRRNSISTTEKPSRRSNNGNLESSTNQNARGRNLNNNYSNPQNSSSERTNDEHPRGRSLNIHGSRNENLNVEASANRRNQATSDENLDFDSTRRSNNGPQTSDNYRTSGKTLSPYDTSFTYKQGKEMSTLGPYVPFTKNYIYSSISPTTTSRPPVYSATIPTYTSTVTNYRVTAKSLIPKIRNFNENIGQSIDAKHFEHNYYDSNINTGKNYDQVGNGKNYIGKANNAKNSDGNANKGGKSMRYLPERAQVGILENRSVTEREHVLSMIHSLQGLESDIPTLTISAKSESPKSDADKSTRTSKINKSGQTYRSDKSIKNGLANSRGPSTLHSLALYFATADTFDSKEGKSKNVNYEEEQSSEKLMLNDTSVELPKSILTQHTINSYAELFKLNNALVSNVTSENDLGADENGDDENKNDNSKSEDDDDDDLDIQQSEGPVNGAKKSNGTKLRELAQVFTHALSAYLQDPDTFKKVLTEIRPTEPPTTTAYPGAWDTAKEASTVYPTTYNEYPSVTKEKDEVLDFSDDSGGVRRRKLTTTYPTTYLTTYPTPYPTTIFPITGIPAGFSNYHTTINEVHSTVTPTADGLYQTTTPAYFDTTNKIYGETESGTARTAYGKSQSYSQSPTSIAVELNRAFGATPSDIQSYKTGSSALSHQPLYPPYSTSNENRIGGFQNNTSRNSQSRNNSRTGKNVTPINDNFVSSTPAYVEIPRNANAKRKDDDEKFKTFGARKPGKGLTSSYISYSEVTNGVTDPMASEVSNSLLPLPQNSTTILTFTDLDVTTPYNKASVADSNERNSGTSYSKVRVTAPYSRFSSTTAYPRINTTPYEGIGLTTASPRNIVATTRGRKRNEATTTTVPFRIRYYETSTPGRKGDVFTGRNSYVSFRNSFSNWGDSRTTEKVPTFVTNRGGNTFNALEEEAGNVWKTSNVVREIVDEGQPNVTTVDYGNTLGNNHWTSSPSVTHLWETTVFLDPKRINHELEADSVTVTQPTNTQDSLMDRLGRSTTPSIRQVSSTTDSPSPVETTPAPPTRPTTLEQTTPWQWVPSNNDAPTAFSLLPTTFQSENTATPTPIITTRSSITTTITSSVTSTSSLPQDALVSSLLPYTTSFDVNPRNVTENEIFKAQQIFGKLNSTSSSMLMRVMKQADNNETVRQLVLLLISHCNGPMNKTREAEKEKLLNALLRMPVNEFHSDESKEIVSGINRLNLQNVGTKPSSQRSRSSLPTTTARTTTTTTTSTAPPPSITTFRSRRGRKFRTTTDSSSTNFARRSDELTPSESKNALSEEETTASDGRALELLRSLYTIAAKWG